MFGKKDLETAEAVIVENHIKHHGGGSGQGNLHEWVADVRPADGEPFWTVIQTPGLALDFREPQVGDVVSVHIDHKNGHVTFDKSDPRLSLKAAEAARHAHFAQVAAEPVASAPTSVPAQVHVVSAAEAMPMLQAILGSAVPAAGGQDAAGRLSRLQQLHDGGALSDEEYATARQRIIDAL